MSAQEYSHRVKFSPRLLRRFSEWLRTAIADLEPLAEPAALLFGAAGPEHSTIQSFWPLTAGLSDISVQQNWHVAFEYWKRRLEADPETSWLDALGWCCLRLQSTGELLASDVEFHNTHFAASTNLAIILHSPTEEFIAADVYTNIPDSPLHLEKHRRASLQLSMGVNGAAPDIRPRMLDQAFIQAYDIASALDREERWGEWKERIHSLTHLDWLRR
jgi:hypothetical protein